VLNNAAWQAITDIQLAKFGAGHEYATRFNVEGEAVTPDLAAAARAFGAHGERISEAKEVKPALERAFGSGGPSVIEVMVNREHPHSGGGVVTGWWDVPVPTYIEDLRAEYEAALAEVRP
jgi:acetolactate synthase-1/2/3 large subunit